MQSVLRRRQAMDDAFAGAALAGLEPRDRAFVRRLVAIALRRLGQIDALIAACLDRPLGPRAAVAQDLLRLGAAQLLFAEVPPHAAVDTMVALAGARRQDAYRGLINAVLRRLGREGAAMLAVQDAARLNTPDWLWESWTAAYGEATARAVAAAHLAEPPLDFTLKDPATAGDWAAALEAEMLPTGSLRRTAGGIVAELPGYEEGAWWVQDAVAALPARLLGDVAGRRVIDMAAAPGGKTLQLAAAGARVTAVDISPKRMALLQQNLIRTGLAAECVVADAAAWRPEAPADAVLIDAPCTATGTIRRHPDLPWLKRPEDVARLTALQDRLLAAAVAMTAPGGRIVYACCSLQPEEGPARIAALLAAGAPVRRAPVDPAEAGGLTEALTPEGDLRTLPCHLAGRGGLDGFYVARLVRTGNAAE